MKKAIALLLAWALCTTFAVPTLAEIESSLGAYEPGKIEGLDLEPIGGISSSLGEYETREIEGLDLEPIGGISSSLGEYETREIEDIDVEPIGGISSSLGEYETREIEDIDVEPLGELHIDLGEYETHEIEDIDVKPLEQIKVELAEYDVPDISDIAPAELQPIYLGMVGYMGEAQRRQLSSLSELEITELVQRQYDLIADLNAAFGAAGIKASIDPVTGRIPINATLLYDTNEYKVTDTGKQVLSTVFRVYCSVLCQEKYRDAISEVVIIGHTDSDGSYDYNVSLSQRRAEAVRDFCLSPECDIEDVTWLSDRLTAEGRSYDERIFNDDGTENKAASRRVEIGCTLAIE